MISQNIFLTTDCVVLHLGKLQTEVLLVKRKTDPFKGKWALPGGFVEDHEDLETAARRELAEETGLEVQELQQISAFGAPGRDPRARTVTIGFLAEVDIKTPVKGRDDAEEAQWFPIHALPELAFDHYEILRAALKLVIYRKF